jgi:hypothetical protein
MMNFGRSSTVNLSRLGFGVSGVDSFDSSAEDFFDYWVVSYNNSIKAIFNSFIVSLKTTPDSTGLSFLWNKIDGLWMAGPDIQVSGLNMRYPSSTPMSFPAGTPQFVPFQYWQSTGTEYINFNWNPSVNAVVFSQNNSMIGAWCESNAQGAGVAMGLSLSGNPATGSRLNPRSATDAMAGTVTGNNINIGTGGSTIDSSGFKTIQRISPTQIRTTKWVNGVKTENVNTSVSQPLINNNMFGLAENRDLGTPTNIDTRQYSLFVVGSGDLTPADFKAIVDTFRS